jgi:hypothetical protein
MTPQPHPRQSDEAPIGGALYRHPARRGRWRVETAGPKWVKFRSTEVMGSGGRWLTFKERREDWPNGWTRA